jgi:carboxymethylenebutenolidase
VSEQNDVSSDNPAQNTSFASNGGQAYGYLALPGSGSGPGVIVIQEWWGLTDYIVGVADRLANEGFVALAPDLFGGKTTHDSDEAGRLMSELPVEKAATDLSGAVDFLLEHPAVTSSKVGAVGFCMGGGFVLMLAAQQGDRIGAAVPFYGVGSGVPDQFTGVTAPVQGHYAEDDQFYPVAEARKQEQQIRQESGAEVEFFYYPAGHAFHAEHDLLGTYDPDAAKLSWQRTVDFLHAKLG